MKLLPQNIRNAVVRSFPKYEHSYEINIHKNVPHTFQHAQIIPKGHKYYVWFKKHNNLYMAYLISQDMKRGSLAYLSFSKTLRCGPKGTLVYGTYDPLGIFYIEKLCIFKNQYVKGLDLTKYKHFFTSINT